MSSNFRLGRGGNLYDKTTGQWVGLLDEDGDEQVVIPPGSTAVTATQSDGGIAYPATAGDGLTVRVMAFRAGSFGFAGGEIQALDNLTQYVGVNVRSGRLHCLPRLGDQGFIPVARVVAAGGKIISISCMPPELPATRIPRSLAKLKNGEDVKITVLGSSLFAGADVATQHLGLVFLPSDVGYGYSAIGDAGTSNLNTDPDFSLAATPGQWGAPTGYSVLPSGGPNDSACIEWSGAGRLFRQYGGGNRTYFVGLAAIPVSGSPVVTLQIKNLNTDTVVGTSGAIPVAGLTQISVSGLTTGTPTGCRVEILVTGGTVRLSDSVIAAYPVVTIKNAAVGGSGSALALALTGTPFKIPSVSLYSDANAEITLDSAANWTLAGPAAAPRASIMDADLVIVGGIANPATGRDLMHEPILHALRSAGCEVLLVTDNPSGAVLGTNPTTWPLYSDSEQIFVAANAYGVAVADTAAYMAEAFLRGLPVYRDTIHQSYGTPAGATADAVATGHECWAEAIAGVVSPAIAKPALVQDVPVFRAQEARQPGQAKLLLAPDLKTSGTASTLAAVATGISGYADFCALFGVPAASCRLRVPVGGIVHLSHPMMIASQLLVQGNDFAADVRTNNGATLFRTINFVAGAGGARPTLLDASSFADFSLTQHANSTITIHVTSGEMWLLAGVVQTPLYEDVTDSGSFVGASWGREASVYADVPVKYTDSVNDAASFRHPKCRSIVIGTAERSQGGTVSRVFDGVAQSDLALVGTSQIRYKTYSGGYLGSHVVTLKLKTAGGAPVAQNRSLAIVQAFAVIDR